MSEDLDAADGLDTALRAARPSAMDVAARFARAEVLQRAGAETEPVTLGRFRVLRRLGAGGFSFVFVAWDPMLEREVALKVLRLDALRHDPRGAQGWLAECRALASLDHPNVVRVFEAGIEDAQPFMVMELLSRDSLRVRCARHVPTWTAVVEWFVAIGHGLAAIHEAGIVHRDFKPDNVLFDAAGQPKVADLGLAREGPGTPEIAGGTPRYMASEQLRGEQATAKSDQYAFFLAMAESLTGRDPASFRDAAQGHGRIDAPGWVRRAVRRGLAEQPDARWPDMHAALAQLEAGLAQRRRIVRASSVVAVGALVAGSVVASQSERRCQRPPEAWSDDAKPRLRSGVLALDRPHIADAWGALEQRLDTYAGQLSLAHCEAVPSELVGRSEACLQHAEASFEDIIELLEQPTPSRVDDTLSIVFALPPVAHCTDPGRLATNTALAVPERWHAVQEDLRAATRRFVQGDLPGAREAAEAAVATAESFSDDGLRARALLRLGEYVARSGALERAVEIWREAYWLALEAGDDGAAARCSEMIGRQVGANLHRTDDGLTWTRTAKALNTRIGATPRERVGVHDATGAVLLSAGRYAEALGEYDAALLAIDEAGVDRPLSRAPILTSRGYALAGLGRLEEARTTLQEALASFEDTLGPHHPMLQRPLGGLASIAADDEPQRALELTQRALNIARGAHGDDHPNVAAARANVGIMLEEVGRLSEARAHYDAAIIYMRRTEHPMLGQVLEASAGLLFAQGRLEEADRRYAEASASLSESVGEDHPLHAAVLRHWADTTDALGDRPAAVAKKRRALSLLEQAVGAEHPDARATRDELERLERDLR